MRGPGGPGGPEHEPAFRPFRSWASAYEEPSIWDKMRERLAGLFSRKAAEETEEPDEELIRTDEHPTDVDQVAAISAGEPSAIDLDEPAAMVADELPGAAEIERAAPTASEDSDVLWLDTGSPNGPALSAEVSIERVEDSPVEEPLQLDALDSAAVAPPGDFKFPWARTGTEQEAPAEVAPTEPVGEPTFLDAAPSDAPDVAAPEKAPGLFSRLFRRKSKPLPPVEPQVETVAMLDAAAVESSEATVEPQDEPVVESLETAAVEEEVATANDDAFYTPPPDEPLQALDVETSAEPFASVEEALPISDDMLAESAIGEAEVDEAAPPAPLPPSPKRGLFARLFGKRAKPEEEFADEPEEEPRRLSVEVYQDRIEAAANALDVAGETAFTPGEDTLASRAAFESVDEALPAESEAPTVADQPLEFLHDELAPPADAKAPAPSRTTLEMEDLVEPSRSTLEIEELTAPPAAEDAVESEEPVSQSRSTLEIEEPVVPGRSTLEIEEPSVESRSTLEMEETDVPSIDTLEIEEKTDEFEIVPPPGSKDDETISMEKKSIWSGSFIARLFRRGDTEVEKVGAAADQAAEGAAVFLLAKFRAFYHEIIRFKHQKSEFTAGFATAIVTDYTADLSPDAAAESLSKRLSELLELQLAEAKWMGGEAGDRYPDAQYAMACLADEIFTHAEWEGQSAWPKFSIEKKLYQSNAADVELFRRIDKLLKEAPDSAVARDLARVYLLVIAAGFRGKYRPFGLTRPLAEYRQRLFEYIHNADALMLYAPERRIFPEAVTHILAGHAVRRFSAAQRWAAILIFLLLSYTVAAHVAWTRASAELKDVTARIKMNGGSPGVR